jgi:deoxyribonuclease-4
MRLGAHVSTAGKLSESITRGEAIGCEAIQIFTSNPKGWDFKVRSQEEIQEFIDKKTSSNISGVYGHLIYLANLASNNPYIRTNSMNSLISGLVLAQKANFDGVVVHIGSHGGRGVEEGIKDVASLIKSVLDTAGEQVPILLETDSGAGNHLGARFSEIGNIIKEVGSNNLGVCFDTCHSFAAGYDIRTSKGIEKTLTEFDKEIGLERLKLLHLNDSKGELCSKVDRHEEIGKGNIGLEAFSIIVNHTALKELSGIVETPDNKTVTNLEELSLSTLKKLRT